MAGAKEIRTKIASIKSTQKITKAMEMVAASKMRKAQDRMSSSRPYAEKMMQVISHLHHAHRNTATAFWRRSASASGWASSWSPPIAVYAVG